MERKKIQNDDELKLELMMIMSTMEEFKSRVVSAIEYLTPRRKMDRTLLDDWRPKNASDVKAEITPSTATSLDDSYPEQYKHKATVEAAKETADEDDTDVAELEDK